MQEGCRDEPGCFGGLWNTRMYWDLDRYAALHTQAYGEPVDAAILVPRMLAVFMARGIVSAIAPGSRGSTHDAMLCRALEIGEFIGHPSSDRT